MAKSKANTLFWNQLLLRSDAISDINPQAADAPEQLLAQLGTICEQFDRAFDPADAFEPYVAVTLCQALRRALTPTAGKSAVPRPLPLTTAPAAQESRPPSPVKPVGKSPAKNSAKEKNPAAPEKNTAAGAASKRRGKTG